MRGLLIREPWIDLILDGRKTWEIRGQNAKVRGDIALIKSGSGLVVGTANLADVRGPFTSRDLAARADAHAVPPDALRDFVDRRYGGRAFAWVLRDPVRLSPPVRYKHPSGAVIWVTLEPHVASAIADQLEARHG